MIELKSKLVRIVAMLTRMAMKFDGVSDSLVKYTLDLDYEHEHRDAEHEHEEMPKHADARETSAQSVLNLNFTPRSP